MFDVEWRVQRCSAESGVGWRVERCFREPHSVSRAQCWVGEFDDALRVLRYSWVSDVGWIVMAWPGLVCVDGGWSVEMGLGLMNAVPTVAYQVAAAD